jgi:hypothetical protein
VYPRHRLNPVHGLALQIEGLTSGQSTDVSRSYLIVALSASHKQWLASRWR